MNCETCGELVTGRGAYCCRKCMPSRHKLIKISCPKCGKIRERRGYLSQARSKVLCLECTSDQFNGEGNPNWKGGHKHWSPGRFGKDKDGLSWKTQRKLAWERDEYTCQHCHEKKNRNPDVHHIIPFRVSQSHALDNLICLCQSCHLKLEATVQDEWGGQCVARPPSPERPKCSVCLSPSQLPICRKCQITARRTQIRLLVAEGLPVSEIVQKLAISQRTVYRDLGVMINPLESSTKPL